MDPLSRELRSQLENTVIAAREAAEAGAQAALDQLGVGEAVPFPHLDEEGRERRRRLRAHGRQLGDHRHPQKETQQTERLTEEVAYEHWHRMLFARFLAENDLLMYLDPDEPVAITLEECADLAADEGARNGWELAARYASGMLPQIFRADSPALELALPPEHEQRLERLIADLPKAVFTAADALGWVYQFWQSARKDAINASEVKIGERELPAVTQLFTEPYMVAFQLDNGLGAWWAARRLSEEDLQSAASEKELRDKAALPGVPLTYLRFVQQEDGTWTPAAGTFEQWPEHLSEFRIMDPCCGSGHFLVDALFMLVPMRMALEELGAREAVDRVLAENLHGLEIDQRCVEIAAFNLALTAWRYPESGGYRSLPTPNLACSGLSVGMAKEEWKQLAPAGPNLRFAMDAIHETFRDAPVLGSLIDPARSEAAQAAGWPELEQTLHSALAANGHSDEEREAGVAAKGLAEASTLLVRKYHLVVTNVPFLTSIKYSEKLKSYIEKWFPDGKGNLATAMVLRIFSMLNAAGVAAFVAPQSWMFLKRYGRFREVLLRTKKLNLVARLGERGFQSPQANGEQVCLNIVSAGTTEDYLYLLGIDAGICDDVEKKSDYLSNGSTSPVSVPDGTKIRNQPVTFSDNSQLKILDEYATALRGCGTGDSQRFVRQYWEVEPSREEWEFHHTTAKGTKKFDGMSEVILWEKEQGDLAKLAGSVRHLNHAAQNWRRGKPNWGKKGVIISQMGRFPSSIYNGDIYDPNCCAIVPEHSAYLEPIVSFCQSSDFFESVRNLNQNRKVEVRTFLSVPFDYQYWRKISEFEYPNGLPRPFSNDPTQWIFHGYPCGSVLWNEETKWTAHGDKRADETVLQVAVARLLGYRWPAEQDPDMELAAEQREWVAACEGLLSYADDDGIVCIPPVGGEAAAADRLLNLLAAAYGDDWSNDVLSQLLQSVDHGGKTLESWLRDKFFAQHFKLFQQRPFIWHIWDGLKDGFSALVNYHKLDYKNLETLTYTYLGDWIARQKQERDKGVDGAEERLAAAEQLQKRLERILEGEAPYDIFVRWKPKEEQPIGWNPDLNDGVRLNIRPFMTVDDVWKKGTGILREKPNINWKKDRGRDVESAPWYHLGPEYGGNEGDRINDHHLSLAEKQGARANKGESG